MFEETRVSVLEAIILVPAVHGRLPRLQRALTLLMLLSLTTSLGVKNFSLPHFIDEDTSPGYYRGAGPGRSASDQGARPWGTRLVPTALPYGCLPKYIDVLWSEP